MSRFGSSEQIRLAYLQNDSLDDYFANYYTTDHHWNGYGASETYNALAFDSREGFKASSVINTSGLEINGSLARSGLDLLDEPVSEPLLDTSGMLADYVDGSIPLLQQGEIGLKDESLPVEFNFYHEWYRAFGKLRNQEFRQGPLGSGGGCWGFVLVRVPVAGGAKPLIYCNVPGHAWRI